MVSEVTNTHELLVQSMLVCTVAYIFSQKWSIYASQVKTQTHSPVHRGQYIEDILENLKAHETKRQELIKNQQMMDSD
jgi:CIC family chloride channel protein